MHQGSTVLVNRGFVPRDLQDPSTRPKSQITGPVTVTGLLRSGEKTNAFTPDNVPAERKWFWIDLPTMSQLMGAVPILVDADASGNEFGPPYGGQTVVTPNNRHLGYAFTWYGLAALTGYAVFVQLRSYRRGIRALRV